MNKCWGGRKKKDLEPLLSHWQPLSLQRNNSKQPGFDTWNPLSATSRQCLFFCACLQRKWLQTERCCWERTHAHF